MIRAAQRLVQLEMAALLSSAAAQAQDGPEALDK